MKYSYITKLYLCVVIGLTVSKSAANQTLILPDDGKAEDYFGYSAAIDNTTLLVGAHKADIDGINDAGAAYIFVLTDSGWHQQAKLIANPAVAEDTLGGNVALKNDVAMLGVMRRDDRGQDSGAVVSFQRDGKKWFQKRIFTAPDGRSGDAFGQSIALTDKFLAIGAPRHDAIGRDSGAVYIYQRAEVDWQLQCILTASDGSEGDLFGISLALDGNTLLVGADLHDEKAKDAGAVYVYQFDENQWNQQTKLMAADGAQTDLFGVRVSLHGDTALVSARRGDIENIGVDAGSAYIFERIDGQWSQTQKLVAPDGNADDRFGRGVAIGEDRAVVSAMHHDANGNNAGAVYVFEKKSGSWYHKSKILADGGRIEDKFGWNIALSDMTAVISVPHRDDKGSSSGGVYVIPLKVF
jgi:hypothetical protein